MLNNCVLLLLLWLSCPEDLLPLPRISKAGLLATETWIMTPRWVPCHWLSTRCASCSVYLPLFSPHYCLSHQASLEAQMLKNLPAMQETWVGSLGGEDTLEKGMVTHSSILAKRIPWPGEPGRLQPMGSQRIGNDWATNTFHSFHSFNTFHSLQFS